MSDLPRGNISENTSPISEEDVDAPDEGRKRLRSASPPVVRTHVTIDPLRLFSFQNSDTSHPVNDATGLSTTIQGPSAKKLASDDSARCNVPSSSGISNLSAENILKNSPAFQDLSTTGTSRPSGDSESTNEANHKVGALAPHHQRNTPISGQNNDNQLPSNEVTNTEVGSSASNGPQGVQDSELQPNPSADIADDKSAVRDPTTDTTSTETGRRTVAEILDSLESKAPAELSSSEENSGSGDATARYSEDSFGDAPATVPDGATLVPSSVSSSPVNAQGPGTTMDNNTSPAPHPDTSQGKGSPPQNGLLTDTVSDVPTTDSTAPNASSPDASGHPPPAISSAGEAAPMDQDPANEPTIATNTDACSGSTSTPTGSSGSSQTPMLAGDTSTPQSSFPIASDEEKKDKSESPEAAQPDTPDATEELSDTASPAADETDSKSSPTTQPEETTAQRRSRSRSLHIRSVQRRIDSVQDGDSAPLYALSNMLHLEDRGLQSHMETKAERETVSSRGRRRRASSRLQDNNIYHNIDDRAFHLIQMQSEGVHILSRAQRKTAAKTIIVSASAITMFGQEREKMMRMKLLEDTIEMSQSNILTVPGQYGSQPTRTTDLQKRIRALEGYIGKMKRGTPVFLGKSTTAYYTIQKEILDKAVSTANISLYPQTLTPATAAQLSITPRDFPVGGVCTVLDDTMILLRRPRGRPRLGSAATAVSAAHSGESSDGSPNAVMDSLSTQPGLGYLSNQAVTDAPPLQVGSHVGTPAAAVSDDTLKKPPNVQPPPQTTPPSPPLTRKQARQLQKQKQQQQQQHQGDTSTQQGQPPILQAIASISGLSSQLLANLISQLQSGTNNIAPSAVAALIAAIATNNNRLLTPNMTQNSNAGGDTANKTGEAFDTNAENTIANVTMHPKDNVVPNTMDNVPTKHEESMGSADPSPLTHGHGSPMHAHHHHHRMKMEYTAKGNNAMSSGPAVQAIHPHGRIHGTPTGTGPGAPNARDIPAQEHDPGGHGGTPDSAIPGVYQNRPHSGCYNGQCTLDHGSWKCPSEYPGMQGYPHPPHPYSYPPHMHKYYGHPPPPYTPSPHAHPHAHPNPSQVDAYYMQRPMHRGLAPHTWHANSVPPVHMRHSHSHSHSHPYPHMHMAQDYPHQHTRTNPPPPAAAAGDTSNPSSTTPRVTQRPPQLAISSHPPPTESASPATRTHTHTHTSPQDSSPMWNERPSAFPLDSTQQQQQQQQQQQKRRSSSPPVRNGTPNVSSHPMGKYSPPFETPHPPHSNSDAPNGLSPLARPGEYYSPMYHPHHPYNDRPEGKMPPMGYYPPPGRHMSNVPGGAPPSQSQSQPSSVNRTMMPPPLQPHGRYDKNHPAPETRVLHPHRPPSRPMPHPPPVHAYPHPPPPGHSSRPHPGTHPASAYHYAPMRPSHGQGMPHTQGHSIAGHEGGELGNPPGFAPQPQAPPPQAPSGHSLHVPPRASQSGYGYNPHIMG